MHDTPTLETHVSKVLKLSLSKGLVCQRLDLGLKRNCEESHVGDMVMCPHTFGHIMYLKENHAKKCGITTNFAFSHMIS